jgi:hypothetical protein
LGLQTALTIAAGAKATKRLSANVPYNLFRRIFVKNMLVVILYCPASKDNPFTLYGIDITS